MAEPLFSIDGLSVGYRTPRGLLRALDEVSLSVPRGGALGLVGESGSGKSTVVMAALGLLAPSARVTARGARFDGADLLAAAPSLRGRRIGVVFQDPAAALNPALPVGLQVIEAALLHRPAPRAALLERAAGLLGELGIARPHDVLAAYPHQLSGGMKQRALIAAALLPEPDLLLLDEPTTALDVTVEAQILDKLAALQAARGLSMLLVSHNLGVVDRLCDTVAVLYAGRLVESGPTAAVLATPQHPYTRALLAARPGPARTRLVPIPGNLPDLTVADPGCNFRPRCPLAEAACAAPQALTLRADGRAVRCRRAGVVADTPLPAEAVADARTVQSAPLLEGRGLVRSFRRGGWFAPRSTVHAVADVSVAIGRGEVLGLVGESGSGKSTLGRLLLRLEPAEGGTLAFDGQAVPAAPAAAFRRRAQIVLQNPDTSLNPRQRIGTILRRPLARFGLPAGTEQVAALLAMVRLPADYASRFPHQLSGGEKQRVGIARALASRPDFVVCDEAVSALDVSVQAAVLNLLADLRAATGVALLFISHDIGVVAHIADRIAVMYRGRIVEEGPAAEVLRPPFHPYTEALLSAVPVVGAGDRVARIRLAGEPDAPAPPGGCPFAPRCPRRIGEICDAQAPPWRTPSSGHRIACHLPLDG